MADHVQPDAGEEREVSSSGLLLSVDPLQGGKNYKLAGDDSDSDKGGLLGDDGKASDSDGSDSLLGGDSDGSDALGGDSDGTDARGGDTDGSDSLLGDDSDTTEDADGSDAGGIAADSDSADAQMNPLGIGDTNVDGPEGGSAASRPAVPVGDQDGEDD
jgi:hypothetical protein